MQPVRNISYTCARAGVYVMIIRASWTKISIHFYSVSWATLINVMLNKRYCNWLKWFFYDTIPRVLWGSSAISWYKHKMTLFSMKMLWSTLIFFFNFLKIKETLIKKSKILFFQRNLFSFGLIRQCVSFCLQITLTCAVFNFFYKNYELFRNELFWLSV